MRVVTIDGPAGAGKSTVSKRLAEQLGWRLLDTGAMYRAVALAAIRAGVDLSSDDDVGAVAERIDLKLPPGWVLLDGEDVSEAVRSLEVTRAVKYVADSPRVRRRMVALQRAFAAENDVVAEGRDQGTVVFPDAFCKFFITASLEERARRRHAEYAAKGDPVSFETVLQDMTARDIQDASRAIAPMKPAADAALIDTTGRPLEDVLAEVEQAVRQRLGGAVTAARQTEGVRP
jgi:cytidylate kinase